MIYLRLFWEFLKVGLFTIGGGLAALPYLSVMSENTGWFTQQQLTDMIAVSESTPGPIGINCATYVGFTTAGPLGSLCATIGMMVPGFLITLIVAKYIAKYRTSKIVDSAFYGLRPAVCALIALAAWKIIAISIVNISGFLQDKSFFTLINYKALILFAVILFAVRKFKKHPIIYIGAAALVGIILRF